MRKAMGFVVALSAAMFLVGGPALASTFWVTGLTTKVNPAGGKVTYIQVDNYYIMWPTLKCEEHTYDYGSSKSAGTLFLLDGEPVSAKEFFVPGRVFCLYDKELNRELD